MVAGIKSMHYNSLEQASLCRDRQPPW